MVVSANPLRSDVKEAKGSVPLSQVQSHDRTEEMEEPWDSLLMTYLPERDTGLPMLVYVSLRHGGRGPRIKVSQSYGSRIREGMNPFFLPASPSCRVQMSISKFCGSRQDFEMLPDTNS